MEKYKPHLFRDEFEALIAKYGYAYPVFVMEGFQTQKYDIMEGEEQDKDGTMIPILGFFVGVDHGCPCCREKHGETE